MSNLKKGLVAYIKLDAYDYSIYGSMKGEVEYISPDALMEQTKGGENIYYKVKIRIKQDEFKEKLSKNIQIDPGMTVGVDIKTGQRTVLTYLLKPIIKTLNQSLNET
jgi:adhesin transport system membrane fusion protein